MLARSASLARQLARQAAALPPTFRACRMRRLRWAAAGLLAAAIAGVPPGGKTRRRPKRSRSRPAKPPALKPAAANKFQTMIVPAATKEQVEAFKGVLKGTKTPTSSTRSSTPNWRN